MTTSKETLRFVGTDIDFVFHLNAKRSEWSKKIDRERLAAREQIEREAAAANAERDRAVIAKLCRKKHYREKYVALGLWPMAAA